jgi:hypothetical protein
MYECKQCNFKSDRLNNYNSHCKTDKHKKLTCLTEQSSILQHNDVYSYICKCGKSYQSRYGLYYHEKRCNESEKYDETKLITHEISKTKQLIKNNDLEKEDVLNLLTQLESNVIKEKKPKKVSKKVTNIVGSTINAPTNNLITDNSIKNTGTIDNSVKMSKIDVKTYITNNYAPIEPLMILTEKEVLKLLELNPETSGDHCLGELILFY